MIHLEKVIVNDISAILNSSYGINANSIIPVKGGFSAKAFRIAATGDTEYFLKVYDKSLPTIRQLIDRIDAYMPALDFLSARPGLKGRILTPMRARDGKYKVEMGDSIFVLFLYVQGETPGIKGMTCEQTTELAKTLAILHNTQLPFEAPGLAEDVTLPFLERLACYLDEADAKNDVLSRIVRPQADILLAAIAETRRLKETVRINCGPLVLCHGDAHGNNVIQSSRCLVLVDWEELHWAPAEADLFIHAWHPYGSVFLEAYAAARCGFCINRELLRFYVLRRRLEDIWLDVQRFTEESPDDGETEELLDWVRQGIAATRTIIEVI